MSRSRSPTAIGVVYGNKWPKGRSASPERLWRKGQSGNPSGRPKGAHDVKTLARSCTKEAVEKLKQLMRDSKSDMVQMQCAIALLDRAYGRPRQEMDVTTVPHAADEMPEEMVDEAIRRLQREIEADAAAEPGDAGAAAGAGAAQPPGKVRPVH